ncbi:hypothetical protein CJF32_00006475 [Rutstroemia sp. NJR-2017a WRK4]|nr:hypothetical protein CJF32_00006475 [Rutstroemia sp. NJR-2017a WRK4]
MKLIVTGATGFVGQEVIRQAIRNPAVTSIIALARKVVPAPSIGDEAATSAKFQSVILKDWTSDYPESVKQRLRDADACIWTLAITPSKAEDMDFAEVTKVNYDYTINGLQNMLAVAYKPFRFIYTSGALIERDQNKTLTILGDYRHMCGRTENELLRIAEKNTPDFQVTVAKPGAIDGPDTGDVPSTVMKGVASAFANLPRVHVSELAAAMIEQCLKGFTKDTLWGMSWLRLARCC